MAGKVFETAFLEADASLKWMPFCSRFLGNQSLSQALALQKEKPALALQKEKSGPTLQGQICNLKIHKAKCVGQVTGFVGGFVKWEADSERI